MTAVTLDDRRHNWREMRRLKRRMTKRRRRLAVAVGAEYASLLADQDADAALRVTATHRFNAACASIRREIQAETSR